MADIQFGQTHRFGFGLGQISDAPISVGLPHPRLASWPRIADERSQPRHSLLDRLLGAA